MHCCMGRWCQIRQVILRGSFNQIRALFWIRLIKWVDPCHVIDTMRDKKIDEKRKRTPSFLLDDVRPNEHQKEEEEDRI